MRFHNILIAFITIALSFHLGCSGGSYSTPVTPGENVLSSSIGEGSHHTWGLWQFAADPEAGTLDIIQLRSGNFHVNALPFLEPPPLLNLSLESLEFNGNVIEAGIGLRHPFLGLTEFTGFDVCGILISNGSVTGFSDSGLRMTGEGDLRLLNPDGLSRWWNPAEFPVNDGTIFSYNDGLLGAPDSYADYNCTLNGYKYFCEDLDPDAPLSEVDLAKRGMFSAGQKNVRQFSIDLGDVGLIFNYAIDANWVFPSGDSPWQAPEDFPPEANRAEAWRADVTETENTLWNDGSGGLGGNLSLSINVYDWYNADLNTVRVESPGSFNLVESSTPTGGGTGYSTYEIDIIDATPGQGSIDLLISVESEQPDFQGFISGVNITAYFPYAADVAPTSQAISIYVDGDNQTGIEDGTEANPYNTIQEGIDAAPEGVPEDVFVEVDAIDGGGEYIEKVTLKSDIAIEGTNWNGGTGKPKIRIAGSEYNYMEGNAVSNVVIDGFDITSDYIDVPWWGEPGGFSRFQLIYLEDCDDITISDCRFHTTVNMFSFYCIYATGGSDLTIEHNEFVDLFNLRPYNWSLYTVAAAVNGTDGVTIKQNEVHHLNYQHVHDGGDARHTCTYGFDLNNCPSSVIENNLIYDFYDFSEGDGTFALPSYVRRNIMYGIRLTNCPGTVIANNTIDDFNAVAASGSQGGETAGIMCNPYDQQSESVIIKNNIVSNIVTTELTSLPQFVGRGFSSSFTLTVPYSCVFSLDLGVAGACYHDQVIKGTGSFENYDNEDPAYDMTPGANYYHVTNPNLVSDDATEMGAFGGPEGSWLPPSQE